MAKVYILDKSNNETILFVSVSLRWSRVRGRVVHCEVDQEDSARTLTTRSTSDLTTARSLCHVVDTAALCRGKYRSAHISVNGMKHLTNWRMNVRKLKNYMTAQFNFTNYQTRERNMDSKIWVQLEEDGSGSTRHSWMETSSLWPIFHW